jgi:hypothetical protein
MATPHSPIAPVFMPVSSFEVGEDCKFLENEHRAVNIARVIRAGDRKVAVLKPQRGTSSLRLTMTFRYGERFQKRVLAIPESRGQVCSVRLTSCCTSRNPLLFNVLLLTNGKALRRINSTSRGFVLPSMRRMELALALFRSHTRRLGADAPLRKKNSSPTTEAWNAEWCIRNPAGRLPDPHGSVRPEVGQKMRTTIA